MQQLWLVTIPVSSGGSSSKIKETIDRVVDPKRVYKFEIPNDLTIGTLDTLMALSDDLNKINSQVEVF